MFICAGITTVVGATRAEAEDKKALLDKLPLEIDALSLLSEGLNFDFATKGMDEPLTDQELASFQGMLTIRDQVVSMSGKTKSDDARFPAPQQSRPDPRRDRRRSQDRRR